ncbi:MAG: peptide chain release factor N(5)-glutamine methyltransferase, partial [Treponema sp.]|nr:peptide chain release factor N(5)-glutamine methyltransferase [Treponema sp.]
LLAEALDCTREQLYMYGDDYTITEAQSEQYFEFLKRRRRGECTAYILGHKEFWGLDFCVSPAVLVPRPDTEILVEAAHSIIHSRYLYQSSVHPSQEPSTGNGKTAPILDLCTGCGAIAIALKHEWPGLEVWASDISEEALEIAGKNAKRLGCEITFLPGDLFNNFANNSCFFLITANAPYVPSEDIAGLPAEVRKEPRIALDGGADGLSLIQRIITEAPLYLETGGNLVLEADPSQMETIAALMINRGFAELVLYPDLAGKNRVIAAAFFP